MTGTFEQTIEQPQHIAMDFGYSQDTTLSIGNDGRPVGLTMPISMDGGATEGANFDVFDVGVSRTATTTAIVILSGRESTVETTTTVTVQEATFTADSFRVVYEYSMTIRYTGGIWEGVVQNADGTTTYEASIEGDSLAYSQRIDQNFEQTAWGVTMVGKQIADLTGTLTRK